MSPPFPPSNHLKGWQLYNEKIHFSAIVHSKKKKKATMSCGKRSCNYKVSMALSKREGSIEKSREIALISKVSTMKQGGDDIQQLFISISAAQQNVHLAFIFHFKLSYLLVFLLLSLIHVYQNSMFLLQLKFLVSILRGWKFSE